MRPILFIAVLLLMPALAACGEALPLDDLMGRTEESDRPVELGSAGRVLNVSLENVPLTRLEPVWQRTYPGLVWAALSPTGQHAAVYGDLDGNRTGIELLNRQGQVLWTFPYPRRSLRPQEVRMRGEPVTVAAVALEGSESGIAQVLDASGHIVWRREISGPSRLLMSEDASRFALVEKREGRLVYLDRARNVLAEHAVSPEVDVTFVPDKNLLFINDMHAVRLLEENGSERWGHSIRLRISRNVSLSRDAERVAVSTLGRDSTVYLFNSDGGLRWRKQLFLGGYNDLVFSPQGDRLYVYNVGERRGIYALNVETGEVEWRLFVHAGQDRRFHTLSIRPTASGLRLHGVRYPASVSWEQAGEAQKEHWILSVNRSGEVVSRMQFGRLARPVLSEDGRFLLNAIRSSLTAPSPSTRIALFALPALGTPAGSR